jgi:trans-L-3-hydroxyproline dehydratase
LAWEPPPDWLRLTTLDAHAAGEPLRVVTAGFPDPPGSSMLEKRAWVRAHADQLRRALMWEPRGHADMYGCLLTPPVTADGDVGVLFMHNEGFSTMCGHGIIGLVTVGVETGRLRPRGDDGLIRIDTPAGRVTARAHVEGDRVRRVSFRNVPSFVLEAGLRVEVPGLGPIRCDLAFGGAFYAYVDAEPLGLEIAPAEHSRLIEVGMRIKRAVSAARTIVHPAGAPDLNFLYGTILVRRLGGPVHSRNACIFAEGEVDRSPTGTGVSGRAAILHRRGELRLGQAITIESVIGTRFTVAVLEQGTVGTLPAIVPEVSGSAHLTGRHEFLIAPDDPLRDGFLLRHVPD